MRSAEPLQPGLEGRRPQLQDGEGTRPKIFGVDPHATPMTTAASSPCSYSPGMGTMLPARRSWILT